MHTRKLSWLAHTLATFTIKPFLVMQTGFDRYHGTDNDPLVKFSLAGIALLVILGGLVTLVGFIF